MLDNPATDEAAEVAASDFTDTETDTGVYRMFSDGTLLQQGPDGSWVDVTKQPRMPPHPPNGADDDWAEIPPSQRMLLKIVNTNMERTTNAVIKMGDELPERVQAMGAEMAKELRQGLRTQALVFFFAFLVLVVAVVALAGGTLNVKSGTFEVGTEPAAHVAP